MASYVSPILGGLLIGCSSVFMLYLLGRITGISGIFWGAIYPFKIQQYIAEDKQWRWLFVLGLPTGALLAQMIFDIAPESAPSNNTLLTIASGLLVGFGTKLGSGCTSGHGVCGIGRFSQRSIIATVVFMASGIVTVFIVNMMRSL